MSTLTRKIQILPENLIHKIAAGEVVERPISVVKELVENSLDAGSDQIEIELLRGGIDSIIIRDNGCGIAASELSLALTRHATSKLQTEADLFSINTLGFRGEALPAIASVSNFSIESATLETAPQAYVVQVKQGSTSLISENTRSRGTTIRVDQLFCTTPARLKFLKRPETEWSHIADYVTAAALGRPDVEWKVNHNGKVFLLAPITSKLTTRVLDIFGSKTAEQLYPFSTQVSEIKLEGLLGHPNFSRKNNRDLYVYVNGRYVQDRLLNHAIVSGYRSLLMTQQYPFVILNLEISPSLVDVNVHPSKREVRFANGNAIHNLIAQTIERELLKSPWRNAVGFSDNILSEASGIQLPHLQQNREPGPREHFSTNSTQSSWNHYPKKSENIDFLRFIQTQAGTPKLQESAPNFSANISTLPFASIRLIGQFSNTYLLCEHEGSLVLVDQHAAHERIGFEKLKQAYQLESLASQAFLTPLVFDLSLHESQRLKANLEELEKIGLRIEEFGENSFALHSHPTLLSQCQWVDLIKELSQEIELTQKTKIVEDRIDHLLATMACHRQIRANEKLEQEEMLELLKQLEGTPRSYHCPHGRPVMVEISKYEIEKWFKRVL